MIRKISAVIIVLTIAIQFFSLAHDFWLNFSEIGTRFNANLALIILMFFEGVAARYLLSPRTWKYRNLWLLAPLFLISTVTAACIITLGFVDRSLERRSYVGVYDDCHKVWGARGLVTEGPRITPNGTQNSIESVSLALASGARGNEIDVYFDRDRSEFIVSHDIPYNLKNGKLLTLEAMLDATGEKAYVWLDFKKLRFLNDAQLLESVAELERLTAKNDLKRRTYVEGEDPFNLAAYRDAGFNTLYDTHPLTDNNLLSSATIGLYKLVYYFGDFTVLGMNYGAIDDPVYGSNTRLLLGNIPVFIYHVDDDAEALGELVEIPSVRVILVNDHSLDRYSLNACPASG